MNKLFDKQSFHMGKVQLCTFVLLLVFMLGASLPVFANGGKGKTEHYAGFARFGDDFIAFDTSFDKVLFLLTSVQNKYKIIQVRVKNNGRSPVLLSDAKDMITIVFKNRQVRGILDMYRRDSAFWDALTPGTRQILAYPANVSPGEEQSVFVFTPADLPDVPLELRYKIATLPDEIVIAPRGTAKE